MYPHLVIADRVERLSEVVDALRVAQPQRPYLDELLGGHDLAQQDALDERLEELRKLSTC